jgi:hypothetical protein
MISGLHLMIYSKDAEADKAFFRDILKLPNVDAGHGWLIFKGPPAELAFHPSQDSYYHEIYLMCDDIKSFAVRMSEQKVNCSEIKEERWGKTVNLTLPGGGNLGVYEPKHVRAI